MRDVFEPNEITENQKECIEKISELCSDLIFQLQIHVKEGRYLSICNTKLEEFAMFANKAISRDER